MARVRRRALPSRLRRRLFPAHRGIAHRILFTRPASSPLKTLLYRALFVAGLCALAFIVLYLDRNGLYDAHRQSPGGIDLLYFTMVTIATVGYGDIVPITAKARLIDAFFIVPIRLIIWFTFLGTAYQFVIQRVVEEFRMKRLQKELQGHVIVCGFGMAGSVAVQELLEGGVDPRDIVVIDPAQESLEAAAELGVIGLRGDPSREDLLQQAQVRQSSAVIVAVNDDATAVLLTLTVRSIAPDTKIIVRIREQTFWRQLRQAGANVIVGSTKIGGLLLANAVNSRYVVPFVNDLLSTRGRVMLQERPAEPHEVGRRSNEVPGVVVIGLARNGTLMSFYEEAPVPIEAGDVLMVIQSTRQAAGSQP
ncbi:MULTISPECIES: potassium channel family protein [unclassified Burkholderia]|uniref:potassium channel family protein n=1 Tax=unclassified Burkholderia TaxID=2613784 RepID=UPI00141F13EF|nr:MULTISPECIES: potassium channel family protein [unclassified Burkholderia]NIE84782.1 potassium channel family protein [Burkholderia sp. Tr-860]NIF63280.1 potassium channel family protein [Burkholderia sp. Cy-647]NIF97953.1 potassium channel family protein [Burkholderia sp. Ax-1720]